MNMSRAQAQSVSLLKWTAERGGEQEQLAPPVLAESGGNQRGQEEMS